MRTPLRTSLFAPFAVLAVFAVAGCSKDSENGGTTSPGGGNNNQPAYNIAPDTALAVQSAVVGSVLQVAAKVTLSGQPSPNVTVTWSATSGNGVVTQATSVSDAAGMVTNTWRISDTARVNVLSVAIPSITSATFQATGLAGPAMNIVRISKDSSATISGASTLLTVRATDKGGNPVPGVTVTWTASGGSLTLQQTKTGASGNADVVFTAGSIGGPATVYTVTAAAQGIGSVSFKVTGL
jgi:Big-like domain-containing protein